MNAICAARAAEKLHLMLLRCSGVLKIHLARKATGSPLLIPASCVTTCKPWEWQIPAAVPTAVYVLVPNKQSEEETDMLKRTALVALPAIALLIGGCANTAQLKQEIEKAQMSADTAQKSADEAKRMAQDAKGTADKANDAAAKAQADAVEAKRLATQAQQDAAAAKSAADAANEKADRMFKKAMSK